LRIKFRNGNNMSLPNSYTLKTGAITDYFEGILNAQAPSRFSYKFLEGIWTCRVCVPVSQFI